MPRHGGLHTEHLGLSLATHGYAKYASELRDLHRMLTVFCKTRGWNGASPQCLSCDAELELTYMRLREVRPQLVWEISAATGGSTIVILHALAKNNNSAVLHTFDVHGEVHYFISRKRFPLLHQDDPGLSTYNAGRWHHHGAHRCSCNSRE